MKNVILLVVLLLFLVRTIGKGQCIEDIRYLIESPEPCFFIGMVDMENAECFDPLHPEWVYTWTISDAENKKKIAEYNGYAFSHSIEVFGGYEFCLSVDKDGNKLTPPEVVDCVVYTTCELCTKGTTAFEYVDCSSPSGCKLKLSGTLPALNAHGLKDFGKIVVTYIPTPEQTLVGLGSFDIVFNHIPVTFHPSDSTITIEDEITVPYTRGCYEYKFVLDLEYGVGAHSEYGGPGCEKVTIYGDKMFKCLACGYNSLPSCEINQAASNFVNETGNCEALGCSFELNERNYHSDASEAKVLRMVVYPNPANDFLTVELPGDFEDIFTLQLINPLGQTVLHRNVNGGSKEEIPLNSLVEGIYLLVVSDGETINLVERIMLDPR